MRDAEPGGENEWAQLLRRITDRPDWSVARLARESGIHRSTIFRWLKGDVQNLTLDSIRLVAETADVDILDALRAASTLVAQTAADRLERDEAEQMILGSETLSPAQKRMMLERYHRRLEAGRRQAAQDVRDQLELLEHGEEATAG